MQRQFMEKSPSLVYGARLELVYGLIAHRGFESLLLRQIRTVILIQSVSGLRFLLFYLTSLQILLYSFKVNRVQRETLHNISSGFGRRIQEAAVVFMMSRMNQLYLVQFQQYLLKRKFVFTHIIAQMILHVRPHNQCNKRGKHFSFGYVITLHIQPSHINIIL